MRIPAKALIGINFLMFILALVGLGYSIFMVSTEGKLCLTCIAIPIEWGYSALGLSIGKP
jgi:hypothetical protein